MRDEESAERQFRGRCAVDGRFFLKQKYARLRALKIFKNLGELLKTIIVNLIVN